MERILSGKQFLIHLQGYVQHNIDNSNGICIALCHKNKEGKESF